MYKSKEFINNTFNYGSNSMLEFYNSLNNGRFNSDINIDEETKKFLSLISHNIKNPFGALLGYADLLKEDFDSLNKAEKLLYIDQVKKTAELSFRYIERFFEWLYYKTGKIEIEPNEVSLKSIIAESIEELLLTNNYNGEFKLILDEPGEIYCDKNSMRKAIFYIIENSLKYSQPNCEIEITSKNQAGVTKIEFKDNGKGISKTTIAKIFKLNANLFSENNSDAGTGLGLILAKEIIVRNNGIINVSSIEGQGTIVNIEIPGEKIN